MGKRICDACKEVIVTYSSLKNAQNESFQDGIRYAFLQLKLGKASNADDLKTAALYEAPACQCRNGKTL
jgi:hypothetical protein